MTLLETLRRLMADWFSKAVPAVPGEPRWHEQPFAESCAEAETLRSSIRQVTLEQLGITHWSCHTLF
ncbi:hypothetical protein [Bosea sp. (in: a-proteobacteria)]|uniref:hypothetical protein n=1 Tax=Bosea sp. (in: a-proteobacteria) TaxID=1871050 RepID=UPI002FC656E3